MCYYADWLMNRKQLTHDSLKSHKEKTKIYVPWRVGSKAPETLDLGFWASEISLVVKIKAVLD